MLMSSVSDLDRRAKLKRSPKRLCFKSPKHLHFKRANREKRERKQDRGTGRNISTDRQIQTGLTDGLHQRTNGLHPKEQRTCPKTLKERHDIMFNTPTSHICFRCCSPLSEAVAILHVTNEERGNQTASELKSVVE